MRTPMAKAVGVDLSTTNSVIAAWQGGEAAVIPASAGSLITPSVAVFTDTGEPLVGQLARRQAIPNPKGTVYSAECSTGRCFDEVPDEAKADGFDTVPDEHGKARSARRRTSARWCCESSPTTWATRDGGDHHRDHPFQRRPTRGAPRTPDAWRASTCCVYQRADRARTRLRSGQEAARDRARLRPGRRYLRRRRWRARSAVNGGRQSLVRRRLRPAPGGPPCRQISAGERHQLAQGPACAAVGGKGRDRAELGDPNTSSPASSSTSRSTSPALAQRFQVVAVPTLVPARHGSGDVPPGWCRAAPVPELCRCGGDHRGPRLSSPAHGRRTLMATIPDPHMAMVRPVTPRTPEGCEECLMERSPWVHLRLCLTCGHVGCCDSSPRKHARRHAGSAGHPIVQSFQPGEDWRWCYVHEAMV